MQTVGSRILVPAHSQLPPAQRLSVIVAVMPHQAHRMAMWCNVRGGIISILFLTTST